MIIGPFIGRISAIARVWLVAAIILGLARGGRAQSASESQTKAAFLYSFAKFVQWPAASLPDPNAPIVIGIVGKDPFGRDLDEVVRGRSAAGRAVVVRRYRQGDTLDCQILFVSGSERKRLAEVFHMVKHAPVLTVSDINDFATEGGMIDLIADEGHIRLRINADRAEAAGLKVSSKLLAAATLVTARQRESR